MKKKWSKGGFIDSATEGRLEIKPGAEALKHNLRDEEKGGIREGEFLYYSGAGGGYYSEPTIERGILLDKDLTGYVIKVTKNIVWYIPKWDFDTPYHKRQREQWAKTIRQEEEIKTKIASGELDPNNLRDSLYIPRFFLSDRMRDRVVEVDKAKDEPEGLKTNYKIGDFVVHVNNDCARWLYVPIEFDSSGKPDLTKVGGPARTGIVGEIVDCWYEDYWEVGGDPKGKGYSKLPPLITRVKDDPTYEVKFLGEDLCGIGEEKDFSGQPRFREENDNLVWVYSWKELRLATEEEKEQYLRRINEKI